MESISFCRRKFDAIPFCREMQRRYLAVPKINPKSSDAECSAAPKKRFCGNAKPLLFCCFREPLEGTRTARPAALRLRHTKSSEPARFASHRRCFLSAIVPLWGLPAAKKIPPACRNLEPAELGALLFSIDGCQRGKRFASRRGTVYAVSSPAARSPLWAALSAVEGRSWSTLVSNWAR